MKNKCFMFTITISLIFAWLALSPELQAKEPVSSGNSGGKVIGSHYAGSFVPISRLAAPVSTKNMPAAEVKAGPEKVTTQAQPVPMQAVTLNPGKGSPITEGKTTAEKIDAKGQTLAAKDQTELLGNNTTKDTAASQGTKKTINVAYDPVKGTLTYKDAAGKTYTVKIADLGLSAEWMSALAKSNIQLSAELNDDGSVKLLVGKEKGSDGKEGAKKWEFDPSSRLVAHYKGEAGKEKCTLVTNDQKSSDYIWGSPDAKDPGAGPDGHLVVQRFNYDEKGNLKTVDYFTWTSGDRQGQDKARYMYRQDTYKQGDSKTNCPEEPNFTTKYFNDPFPVDWDPVLTGTVSKDKYGNYWLKTTDGKNYLLTARVDGFDADKDGKSGANEMNSMKWESLLGKEITVRGHQVNEDSEGGIYMDGEKADIFEVCDIITKEGCGDKFESLLKNLEDVAKAVDPINSGLVGNNTRGTLGFVNLFNGRLPETSELKWTEHLSRLMTGFAPFYQNNIPQNIRAFATPELESALRALEEDKNDADDTQVGENNDRQEASNTQLSTDEESKAAVDELLEKKR